MDRNQSPFEFLCESFPKVDVRVIKATVLEHGDDVQSAISFLVDSSDQMKDASSVDDLRERYFASKNPTKKVVEQQANDEVESAERFQHTENPQTSDFLSLIDGRLSSCPEESPSPLVIGSSTDVHAAFAIGPDRVDCCDEYAIAEPLEKESFKSGLHDNADMVSTNQVSVTLLEGIVQESINDKESVINLIKDVSNLRAKADQESIAAQRVKCEAARGGEDLLMKADEMRRQISQMKQDNLMRLGEIYGEKAVLATEARELKLRLEQVKQQKQKAIATLHEIRVRLQGCYDTALKEKKMAEEDRQMKEANAQKCLAEEEALMATVEQESKKLEVEAEACTRLREFLVDHGSIIDALQGEMSILCEDVESFKKQVEEGMWSSVSTASLPSGVNPEGPYIFRRFNQPSAASSQDLGQNPEALYSYRTSNSTSCASSSQEVVDSFSGQSNESSLSQGSDQKVDQKVQHKMKPKEDGQCVHCVAHGSSLSGSVAEDTASDYIPSARGDMGPLQSSLDISDELEMLKAFSRQDAGRHNHRRSLNYAHGTAEVGHQPPYPSDIHNVKERLDYQYAVASKDWSSEKKSSDLTNLGCKNHGGDHWVFTMEQLEESSSSNSSVVKVELNDCCSD